MMQKGVEVAADKSAGNQMQITLDNRAPAKVEADALVSYIF